MVSKVTLITISDSSSSVGMLSRYFDHFQDSLALCIVSVSICHFEHTLVEFGQINIQNILHASR